MYAYDDFFNNQQIIDNISHNPTIQRHQHQINKFNELYETFRNKYNEIQDNKNLFKSQIDDLQNQIKNVELQNSNKLLKYKTALITEKTEKLCMHILQQNNIEKINASNMNNIITINVYVNKLISHININDVKDETLQMLRVKEGRCTATKMVLMHLVTGQDVKKNMVDQTIGLVKTLYESSDLDTKVG